MTISVKRARELVGKEADKYTDEQIEEIISNFEVLADIAIDDFIEKRKQAKLKKQEELSKK